MYLMGTSVHFKSGLQFWSGQIFKLHWQHGIMKKPPVIFQVKVSKE